MTLLALAPAAFLAGILMFLAPCTLPLVPGYLAFISGVSESDLADPAKRRVLRRRMLLNALAFVIGFSAVFIMLGVFAGVIGSLLGEWRFALGRAAGILLILFGLTMLGLFRIPLFSGEWRARIPAYLTLGRWESSALIGILFALGWSPCIGPILGSILFLASASATALQGALLLLIFSLGLALPFLAVAWLAGGIASSLSRLAAISRSLQFIGGIVLVILGALMLSGKMGVLITWGFSFIEGYEWLLNYM